MMRSSVVRALLSLSLFLTSCREKEELTPVEKKSVNLIEEFSGAKALHEVQTLTDFGPRPPESDGYRKSLKYLEKTLGQFGWKTTRQEFEDQTPVGPVSFTNLIARFSPKDEVDWSSSVPFVIGSHLDTKRYISITFLGANDSGSSTGVLVELARVLTKRPDLAEQVELVFFDGEEAMLTNIDPKKDGLYGSRHYAVELGKRTKQPKYGIVLDLVGDSKVPLLIGADSNHSLKQKAANAVMKLNLNGKVGIARYSIIDDHVPLITQANLPSLHLIGDFNQMPYWHTEKDTMENLSSEALSNSGKLTLLVLLQLVN